MEQRLIIIRGNSASGKSKVAERLREEINRKVAIVGLDALRRDVLNERGLLENTDIIGLLEQTVSYCLSKDYTVVLEGILSKAKYRNMIIDLIEAAPCEAFTFYLDVPLEETMKRHRTKAIADDVTDEQLKSWYQPKNYLDAPGEVVIGEESTLEDTVSLILKTI